MARGFASPILGNDLVEESDSLGRAQDYSNIANVFVVANRYVACYDLSMAGNDTQSDGKPELVPGGSNWVYGDRFFDREAEIEALRGRVGNGTHTLVTAQRRMGKTSLVRELQRRLDDEGQFATVFVDLEAAMDGADAICRDGHSSSISTEHPEADPDMVIQPPGGNPRQCGGGGSIRAEGAVTCRNGRWKLAAGRRPVL